MINYPYELNKIFDELQKHSTKIIIVGGFVRDALLKIDSKDIDIEVYGISSFAKLEDILKDFGDVNSVGKSFGVCKLQFQNYDLDFSLPRVDNKIGSGHRGFEVEVDPNIDFKTAARRRDFTINAIGYDVKQKKILDPFNGLEDLKNNILKAVDKDTFIEDPLRVLRAAQFCARFELKVEDTLLNLCKEMTVSGRLNELPKERVFEEIKKLLLKSRKPSIGFELLKEFGSDIYTNNMYVLDGMSKQLIFDSKTNIVLMLAALCYDFTPKKVELFIHKLTNEKELLQRVLPLVENHNQIDEIYYSHINDYKLFKLASEVKIEELLILSRAIYFYKNMSSIYEASELIYKRAKELNILKEKLPPLLKGKDILVFGIEPSPEFSAILDAAYEAQMKSEFNSHNMAIKWLEKYLLTHF